jgi:L-ascorbate metabolism protein UlaG (beta-lactamase superfamily)
VLVEMDGARMVTDPLLRARVTHLRRAVPIVPAELGRVDAVLLSHLHYDHLDPPSLRRLGRDVTLVVPRGAGPFVRRKTGGRSIQELAAGEELSIGHVRVRATPAAHDSGRLPLGVRAAPLGFLLEGTHRVYFAGDTELFDGMAALAPLGVALVPVWGWGPRLGSGHLDPENAAGALRLLRPRIAVPIHWGTYRRMYTRGGSPDELRRPAEDFAAAARLSAPEVDVRILAPGESTEV